MIQKGGVLARECILYRVKKVMRIQKGGMLPRECMGSFVSYCLSFLWDCQYQCPHMSRINFFVISVVFSILPPSICLQKSVFSRPVTFHQDKMHESARFVFVNCLR